MRVIPQVDLKAGLCEVRSEVLKAISETIDSGWYILGAECKDFEQQFSAYCGCQYGVGVANGTDAIELILRALGIGKGDRVVTVSHTAVATVAAIQRAGAEPCLVDICADSYTMCPDSLSAFLKGSDTNTVKAIIPVHLYGYPADMNRILEIANQHKIPVIEDCAQAHGASIDGKKVGSFGVAGAFSFYPTKNLGAIGDGGIFVTNDSKIYESACMIRQYGWRERYHSEVCGINSRLDELQAAILNVRLNYLDEDNKKRRRIADQYSKQLVDAGVKLPNQVKDRFEHVYHQYVIRIANRDQCQIEMEKRGVKTAIHYPLPVHLQKAYEGKVRISREGLSKTETVCKEILSLPMYPSLSCEDVNYVTETFKQSL